MPHNFDLFGYERISWASSFGGFFTSSARPQGLDHLSAQRDCEEYTWGRLGQFFLGGVRKTDSLQ